MSWSLILWANKMVILLIDTQSNPKWYDNCYLEYRLILYDFFKNQEIPFSFTTFIVEHVILHNFWQVAPILKIQKSK